MKGWPPPPLSLKELCERWHKCPNTIRKMEKEGRISRCKNLSGVWYTSQSILKCEEGDEPMTALERFRLLRENAKLRAENNQLKRNEAGLKEILGC